MVQALVVVVVVGGEGRGGEGRLGLPYKKERVAHQKV